MHLFFTEEDRKIDKKLSRHLLKKAIVRYSKISGREISSEGTLNNLKLTDKGKPYIEGFSHFSISHTENIWAVIFSEKKCGLDIQVRKNGDFIKVGEKVFSENDVEKIREFGEKAFFKLWTRKEAYVKALGESIFEEVPELFTGDNKIHLNGYTVFDIELGSDIFSSVCIEGVMDEINLEKVKL